MISIPSFIEGAGARRRFNGEPDDLGHGCEHIAKRPVLRGDFFGHPSSSSSVCCSTTMAEGAALSRRGPGSEVTA